MRVKIRENDTTMWRAFFWDNHLIQGDYHIGFTFLNKKQLVWTHRLMYGHKADISFGAFPESPCMIRTSSPQAVSSADASLILRKADVANCQSSAFICENRFQGFRILACVSRLPCEVSILQFLWFTTVQRLFNENTCIKCGGLGLEGD